MITNPHATRILCFGDSNTWGQHPGRKGRFGADQRWTGILQQQLGDNFEVIEEGLNSRTTDLDYAKKPGRNGKTYFAPCLQSHYLLDIVVIMLGTNDVKLEYGPRPAGQIAQAVKGLMQDVRQFAAFNNVAPQIVIASPISINVDAPLFDELYSGYYDAKSVAVARELAEHLQAVANQEQASFIDASAYAQPGEDGIHMNQQGHNAFAKALAVKIKGITA